MPDAIVPTPSPSTEQLHGPDCCLDLPQDTTCDTLDFRYRLTHDTVVRDGRRSIRVPVEVVITARLERCPGPMALGDLVHTTTLLPGERVRLYTTDRKSQYLYDAETKVSYRNQYASEERTFLASISHDMSNISSRDGSAASPSGGTGGGGVFGSVIGAVGAVLTGGLSLIGGSHNGGTTRDFARELSQHAEASSHRAESATRAVSSVAVGETQTRTHAQGESEDHYESSSRELSNPNRCHAVTYSFYQVNKTQTVRFTLLSVNRQVADPVGPASIDHLPPAIAGATSVVPHLVLSTDPGRLTQESVDRRSDVLHATAQMMQNQVATKQMSASQADAVARKAMEVQKERQDSVGGAGHEGFGAPIEASDMSDIAGLASVVGFAGGTFVGQPGVGATSTGEPAQPWPDSVRQQALDQVGEDLIKAGILDPSTLAVAAGFQKELSWEQRSSLPTGGLIVRGCLDDCDMCEPELGKLYALEVERASLQNDLLRKQIDLLETSQEYRCCPPAAPPA